MPPSGDRYQHTAHGYYHETDLREVGTDMKLDVQAMSEVASMFDCEQRRHRVATRPQLMRARSN